MNEMLYAKDHHRDGEEETSERRQFVHDIPTTIRRRTGFRGACAVRRIVYIGILRRRRNSRT
jgi:hypothetical protein